MAKHYSYEAKKPDKKTSTPTSKEKDKKEKDKKEKDKKPNRVPLTRMVCLGKDFNYSCIREEFLRRLSTIKISCEDVVIASDTLQWCVEIRMDSDYYATMEPFKVHVNSAEEGLGVLGRLTELLHDYGIAFEGTTIPKQVTPATVPTAPPVTTINSDVSTTSGG